MPEIRPTDVQTLAYSPEIVDLYRSLIDFQTRMIRHVAAGSNPQEVKKRAKTLKSRLNRLTHSLGPETTAHENKGDCTKGQVWDPILGRCVDIIPG